MSTFFKKITSAISVAAVVVGSVSSTLTASAASEFAPYADALAAAGVVSQQSSEAGYRLGDTITRAEMAKIAVNIKGAEVAACAGNVFSDVTSKLGDLCGYVEAAASAGIVSKSNSKFRPMDLVTRAELVKMLMVAAGNEATTVDAGFADVSAAKVGDLAGYINAAAAAGIVSKSNANFRPNDTASRGEAFKVAAGVAGLTTGDDSDDDLNLDDLFGDDTTSTGTTSTGTTGSTGTTTTPVAAGALSVGLSASSASAASVPSAGTVTFGSFDLTAASSDISVNTIKLTRDGLGQRSDISRVWMEKNGARVSSRQTVGSDNTVLISFSPALTVKAGSTEKLDLVVSLSGTTNSQHKFTVASAADIASSAASVAGTFPVSTATMTTTSYTVTSVAFSTAGTTSTYKVGDTNVELGQFKLQNNASDDKSVSFKSVTLRNEGTGDIAKNLTNLSLYKNGAKISTSTTIDGKYVTFTVNDTITFGRQETYYVRGDINSVEVAAGDSYQFSLRYSDDLNVTESNTGFKANITGATSAVNLTSYSVSGGEIVLSKSTTSPSSQTVSPGTNDVVLLAADLKVAQAVTLQDLAVTFNTVGFSGGVAGQLSNDFSSLKLVVGNNVVSTFTPAASTSTGFTFEGSFTVPSNTTISILANVRTNASGKYKLNDVSIANFGTKEYASNGNTIQSSQLVGSAGGVAVTVGAASLTLTRNDGISDQSLTIGAQNQTLLQFTMRANDVSDVTVTKLKFATGSQATSGFNTSNVSNVQLVVDGSVVSTKSMSAGNVDFNSISVKVPKNSSVTVKVIANFSTAITATQKFDLKLTEMEARDNNSLALNTTTLVSGLNAGPVYTFVGAGTATVTFNSASPNASVLTPSATETEVVRYTLAASNDDLKVTDFYVYNTGSADLSSRVKTASLYDAAGNKLAGGSVVGTGTIHFALGSTSTLVVPKNTSNTVVIVKLAFNDITDSAQTNKTLSLAVGTSGITAVDGTVNGARLVSQATGNTADTVTLTNAVSRSHLLVRSKATVAVSGSATNSTHTFTVTADANNRLTLTGVTVTLANPTNGPATFTLYRDQETTGNEVATGTFASGTTVTSTINFAEGVEISAGSSKTFILSLGGAGTVTVNSKRIFRVTDVKYIDMMNTGSDVTVSSVSAFSNVGLPTAESTFTY